MARNQRRLELQAILERLLGSKNVYFQPGSNITLQYPCIVYGLDNVNTQHANNDPYRITDRWQITYIDRRPDSEVPRKISRLRSARFSTAFQADQLNHEVYTITY